jgi:type I restriction enzyme, S subunit
MRDGWRRVTLGEVAEQVKRGRAPLYADAGLLVLSQKCVRSDNRLDWSVGRRTDSVERPVPDWALVRVGDTLVNSTGRGTLGRAAFVAAVPEPCTVDSHVSIVRPVQDEVEPAFLGLSLSVRQADLESFQSGSTNQTELSRAAIEAIPIDLPPLAEQRRIVDLIASLDTTIEAADRLVDDAERCMAAQRDAIATRCADSTMVSLESVADVVGGVTKDKNKQHADFTEVPYLRVANVQRGHLDLSEVITIRAPADKVARLLLLPGDILFNEGGDRDKLGRGWVWEGQIGRCIHQNHVLRARVRQEGLDPYFVAMWANSRYAQQWFEQMGSQTTNLASLSLSTLRSFPVPLADPETQADITSAYLGTADVATTARSYAEALRATRAAVLGELLSGNHVIPESYDRLLHGVA